MVFPVLPVIRGLLSGNILTVCLVCALGFVSCGWKMDHDRQKSALSEMKTTVSSLRLQLSAMETVIAAADSNIAALQEYVAQLQTAADEAEAARAAAEKIKRKFKTTESRDGILDQQSGADVLRHIDAAFARVRRE